MKRNNLFPFARRAVCRRFVAGMLYAGILLFAASGCTDDADPDTRLPAGKYPMTFTAAVEGLTATRVAGKDAWAENDEVAIQIGTGTTPKKYTVTSSGSLTVASGDTPFYWTNQTMQVNAWYPYNKDAKPDVTVKSDQNTGNNYLLSDYLEAVDATVTFADKQLTFKHRTAKVVVTLVKGDGVTDVSGATVTFVNQTGVDGNGNTVTPKTETESDVTTYTALLIPQQLTTEKSFIKVSITTDGIEREYFYTPKEGTDLIAGQEYTYTITVKKEGLQVTEGTPVSWNETPVSVSPDQDFAFHITAPTTGVTIAEVDDSSLTDNGSGSYTLSGSNKITITVVDGTSIEIKGLYDKSENTYTLKSDLLITIASPQP